MLILVPLMGVPGTHRRMTPGNHPPAGILELGQIFRKASNSLCE